MSCDERYKAQIDKATKMLAEAKRQEEQQQREDLWSELSIKLGREGEVMGRELEIKWQRYYEARFLSDEIRERARSDYFKVLQENEAEQFAADLLDSAAKSKTGQVQ